MVVCICDANALVTGDGAESTRVSVADGVLDVQQVHEAHPELWLDEPRLSDEEWELPFQRSSDDSVS
jgi:hypothetical protein